MMTLPNPAKKLVIAAPMEDPANPSTIASAGDAKIPPKMKHANLPSAFLVWSATAISPNAKSRDITVINRLHTFSVITVSPPCSGLRLTFTISTDPTTIKNKTPRILFIFASFLGITPIWGFVVKIVGLNLDQFQHRTTCSMYFNYTTNIEKSQNISKCVFWHKLYLVIYFLLLPLLALLFP